MARAVRTGIRIHHLLDDSDDFVCTRKKVIPAGDDEMVKRVVVVVAFGSSSGKITVAMARPFIPWGKLRAPLGGSTTAFAIYIYIRVPDRLQHP
jgi:hypothetical protein